MNKKIKINLHYKISITFIIISAIILFGIFISLNKNLQDRTYNIIRANLLKQTFFTKTYLEEEYDKYQQTYELDKFADKVGKNLDLRVTIIGIDGKVLGDSELDSDNLKNVENHLLRPEVKQALESGIGENKRYSTTIKKNMLYIAQTFGKNKTLGIIRLSVSIDEIELVSNHFKNTLEIYLLIAFILIILITFLASIFISKPIREIASIAREFAKGNFSKKIIHSSNDEIGDLIDAFNFMIEQITIRIDEITKSKSRQEAVLLSMFEGLMLVDLNCNILLINQALRELFLIKDDVTGKKPIEIIRNHEIQKIIDCTLNRKCGVETCEISVITPDEKTLLVHAAPVKREKTVEGAVLVFHDITELKKLEKLRREFVANVSHELRTPVSSIKGYTETLIDGAIEDKKNAMNFIKIIHSESERLVNLINDILDLSKIESGKLKMVFNTFNIRILIEKVLAIMNQKINEKNITVKINIPENITQVFADETKIEQVLLNLIDNAIKYNKQNGSIIIDAEELSESSIRINVTDTGIGISKEELPRIFERFYRIDKARSRELGGTGLGLSIAKHIINAHNGDISVTSEIGKGTTFSFVLSGMKRVV